MKDQERQVVLEKMGLKFLRFDDLDVKKNMAAVLNELWSLIDDFERQQTNPPNPL
jgi:very-short-patch-repair endonuclease